MQKRSLKEIFAKETSQPDENELFRGLRTRIRLSAPEAKVLLIVSSDEGDGKTEMSIKLAHSFAAAGKKVLLVDGNMRKGDLKDRLSCETSAAGFEKVLLGEADVHDAIVPLETRNLYILPIQEPLVASTEILEMCTLEDVFGPLREIFNYVIIDSLSLSLGMDAYLLGKISDGALFVTVENHTRSVKLREHRERLDEAEIPLLGAIMYKK